MRKSLGFFLLFALAAACAHAEVSDPKDLLDTTIETLRNRVRSEAAIIDENPQHALALVQAEIAPHIDMRLASRLVLGRHWEAATHAQRLAFVDGLERLLMRIFALYLRDYTDAEVAYSPTVFNGAKRQRAIVRTAVSRAGSPQVSVDYRLHWREGRWKVYDVSIFGISLVKTYHLSIDHDVKQHGLDGVIERINSKNLLPGGADASSKDPAAAG